MGLFSLNKFFKNKDDVNNAHNKVIRIDYNKDSGFIFDSIKISWGDNRELIRKKLNNQHQPDDNTINISQYFDGDESQNIEQRRDIYANYKGYKNYFFFHYDLDERIKEIEFHWGVEITIDGVSFRFDEPIKSIVNRFAEKEYRYIMLDEGDYLFPDLKITLSDGEHTGGEGHGLAYFYATSNIDHLLEEFNNL